MAIFDQHQCCARCREKGQGSVCVLKQQNCEYCQLLTPDQVAQILLLLTNFEKKRKRRKTHMWTLLPSSSSLPPSTSPPQYTLSQPSFRKELEDLDEKWSHRSVRLEALITMVNVPHPSHLSYQ